MGNNIFIIILFFGGCSAIQNKDIPKGALLAQVGANKLYTSELSDRLPEDLESQDSILYVQSLVERWVRDQVMLSQAEKNVPANINMDQLVKDYKKSLLLANYETGLVETHLDNSISNLELQEYYEANKELYILESPILRCHFIKVAKPSEDIDKIRKWWNSEEPKDFEELSAYCAENIETFLLDDEVWHDINIILDELPPGTLEAKNLRSKKDIALNNDDYFYFIRVIETVLKKEIAPLSFVKDKASKIILHKRKIALLEKIKNDIYKTAIDNNEVQIFI